MFQLRVLLIFRINFYLNDKIYADVIHNINNHGHGPCDCEVIMAGKVYLSICLYIYLIIGMVWHLPPLGLLYYHLLRSVSLTLTADSAVYF
jgi:hypothetical protein